ncbi:MAG: DUF5606 domain-containing protein [Flavobacteriaceae bacterium]|nr:DUF5606 domain-containing protein [Flavobacteriaceae bacterium]
MDLSKIIAVSGRPGLYKINTQTQAGVVATSLIDGKRIIANASVQISVLGEIQVYCIGKETPLLDVFVKILAFESGNPSSISPKSSSVELEAYFFKILDDYDEERVYPNDIKKILQWYNLLLSKKMISLTKSKEVFTNKSEEEKI